MFMSQEDVCDTGLALGLGHGGRRNGAAIHIHRRQDPASSLSMPSLTLSLSDDPATPKVEANKFTEEVRPAATARLSSPRSTVSSFSAAYQVKREKDSVAEEMDVERTFSRASDEEEEEGSARKKLRLTKEQSVLLEDRFKEHSTLNPKQKQALAKQLNLRPRQVEVWFQNRRARTKLKQTEVDCEFLKGCCETLSDENRRLQKELQELRALKFVHPPLYMPATLTMCPSCERIAGSSTDGSKGGADGGGAGHFVVAPRNPHFFSRSFTHPAAC